MDVIHKMMEDRKKQLRRETAAALAAQGEQERREADKRILQSLLTLPEYRKAGCIFCYVSTAYEVDTHTFLRHTLQSGKRVCAPLCTGKGVMEARELRTWSQLIKGAYGILEPDASCPPVAPEEIGFAVIPCVTCGLDGSRLGHGGGYYDRYLERRSFPAVCICRSAIVRADIPVMAHDLPMDIIITEKGVTRVAAK